jgi:hypothetical protein
MIIKKYGMQARFRRCHGNIIRVVQKGEIGLEGGEIVAK